MSDDGPRRDYDRIASALDASGSREQRMRKVADLLWDRLHRADVSWVGFYLDRPGAPDDRRLVLGPHRDKPACSPIGLHGACGRALLSGRPLIVPDVRTLGTAYIACDPRDRSEIVIPLEGPDGTRWGVLDLDSWSVEAFSDADTAGLDRVVRAAGLHGE